MVELKDPAPGIVHIPTGGGSRVSDLGVLDGDVLLFGGAYSNLQALEAMLAKARELRIPPERTIHTGDVVAYCGQPRETTELLSASGVHCLMGNCEESVGNDKMDCGCGFPEDSKCNTYSMNWYAHVTKELVDYPHLRDWMGGLPQRIEFVVADRRFAVVHGSPRHVSEFLWASTPEEVLLDGLAALPQGIDGVVSGHSGIPFARFVPAGSGERLWLNAGVIGMPANDGTSRGWFSVLKPDGAGGIKVEVHALEYDARGAAHAISAQPSLDTAYAGAILNGVWPSHDMLPVEEHMATGVPLAESAVLWPPRRPKEERCRRLCAAPQGAAGGLSPAAWAVTVAVASAVVAAALVMVATRVRRRT